MTAKLKNSLTAKIFLITCLLLTAASALTYGLIARLMPLAYSTAHESLLAAQAGLLAEQLQSRTLADCVPLLSRFTFRYGAPAGIQDSAGNTVAGVDPADILPEAEGWPSLPGRAPETVGPAQTDNYIVSCIGSGFCFRDSTEPYQLLVFTSTRAVDQAAEALRRCWPLLAAAILAVSVLASAFYARFITRPIVRLSGISRRLSELDFGWRCGETRTDELGALARDLDTLADRLSRTMDALQTANAALQADIAREQAQERAQLEFFSAVSHELKTPVTILKGQLGGMLDGVGVYADRDKYLSRSLAAARRMERLVQELLTVCRMDMPGAPPPHPVDLAALARECLRDYDELFRLKSQRLSASLPAEAWISGEPPLLKKALGNLLSNAASYSPEGARIAVTVCEADGGVRLTVENEGGRIDPGQLPQLCKAFCRGDPSRSRQTGGSGLGLYLVDRIAERHGGAFQIVSTRTGVLAALRFPGSTETTHGSQTRSISR